MLNKLLMFISFTVIPATTEEPPSRAAEHDSDKVMLDESTAIRPIMNLVKLFVMFKSSNC